MAERVSIEEVVDLTARLLLERGGREPLSHQIAPEGGWRYWLLLAGRGSGKSWAGARWLNDHANGPPCLAGSIPHRMAIVGPTLGDVVEACVKEPAGIKVHDPSARLVQSGGGTFVRWQNGSEAKLFGAHSEEDAERLRAGGNRCAVWIEELAAMRYARLAWDQMEFGLRVGPFPRGVITTTPKPKPIIKQLVADTGRVAISKASTHDNPHLSPERKAEIIARHEGTRLGRQEIYAEILDDVEGALWDRETIEHLRKPSAPKLVKVCIGVDPSAWMGDQAAEEREDEVELGKGVETGIVAVGLGGCPSRPCDHLGSPLHVYRLADVSGRLVPDQWAVAGVDLYHSLRETLGCHVEMTPEVNMGGPMVFATIRSVARGDEVLFTMTNGKPGVRAADSKRARAEPVAALEQQRRAHSVGGLPILEDQLCSWLPTEKWSPDRLDAYVWAVHGLKPWRASKGKLSKATGKQLPKVAPGRSSQPVARRATVISPRVR